MNVLHIDGGGLTMAFAKAVEKVIGKGQGLNYERFLLFALSLYHLDTSAAKRVCCIDRQTALFVGVL